MSTMKYKILGVGLGVALLAGCAGGYTNEDVGTVLGAGGGALVGNAITNDPVGAVVGAGAGALVGREIGRRADDRYYYDEGY